MQILDEYQHHAEFAKDNGICERTLSRYRNEPDGIPFMQFGGKIFIHIPGARKWLERRIQRLNPRRGAA